MRNTQEAESLHCDRPEECASGSHRMLYCHLIKVMRYTCNIRCIWPAIFFFKSMFSLHTEFYILNDVVFFCTASVLSITELNSLILLVQI